LPGRREPDQPMSKPAGNNQETLHVGRPNVGDRALFDRLVDEIFDRRWFTNRGAVVRELETKLAEYLQVNHCVLVCNATIGLQLACHALQLTGEVIVPAYTFVATAHAVHWQGLQVVFADVQPDNHLIDPQHVEALITPRTSAIVAVHLWGQPCATGQLQSIADRHGLKVMYDAAHAFACQHGNTMIGNFGACEVFSFHATKFFNTFEGGAITTNDDALAEKLRLMVNFGFAGPDTVVHLGTNAKMTEVCAAMGLANLEAIPQFIACNRSHYAQYATELAPLPGIHLLDYSHVDGRFNYQYVVIEIDSSQAGVTRDQVHQHLRSHNILARRYFHPGCHRMEPYRSLEPEPRQPLLHTESLCDRVLVLPTGTAVDETDIARVCEIIRSFIASQVTAVE